MATRRSRLNYRALQEARLRRSKRGITIKSYQRFDEEDIIESDVAKSITSALWSDNVSKLTAFHTSSTQTGSGGDYQYEVYAENPQTNASASVQFNIAFGHFAGSGSFTASGASNDNKTPSRAIYTAFANQLLAPGDDQFTLSTQGNQPSMWFLTIARERFKEKMNPNGWEIRLLGKGSGAQTLHLIDDSSITAETSTNGNRVYNVVSGSLADGVKSGENSLGWFYPDLGVLAIGADAIDAATGFSNISDNRDVNVNDTAASHKDHCNEFLGALTGSSYFQGRAEEDISSTHYFCRVKNSEYNFSNNPTFSTTVGQIRNSDMVGNPNVYLTTVGLYNDENELVATAKLSKPLLKNFSREATIRVKLDY